MKEKEIYCPFCGSKKFHVNVNDGKYECDECHWLFDEEEMERQSLRHQISCLLNGTSEREPKEVYFMIPSAEEDACGLSCLEIPHIDKIFEVEGEGTMWFHEIGENELESGKPIWRDLDELPIGDLRGLLDYLRNEL